MCDWPRKVQNLWLPFYNEVLPTHNHNWCWTSSSWYQFDLNLLLIEMTRSDDFKSLSSQSHWQMEIMHKDSGIKHLNLNPAFTVFHSLTFSFILEILNTMLELFVMDLKRFKIIQPWHKNDFKKEWFISGYKLCRLQLLFHFIV